MPKGQFTAADLAPQQPQQTGQYSAADLAAPPSQPDEGLLSRAWKWLNRPAFNPVDVPIGTIANVGVEGAPVQANPDTSQIGQGPTVRKLATDYANSAPTIEGRGYSRRWPRRKSSGRCWNTGTRREYRGGHGIRRQGREGYLRRWTGKHP